MIRNNQKASFDTYRVNQQLLEGLREVFGAETELIKAIPCFARAATSKELTATFDLYAAQTEEHIARIKKIFDLLGQTPAPSNTRIQQLLSDTNRALYAAPFTRDISLISGTLKIEKYQIALYDSLVHMAKDEGLFEIESILQTILNQEIERQRILSDLKTFPAINYLYT